MERISLVPCSSDESVEVKLLATDELGTFGDCDVVGLDKTFKIDRVILWMKLTLTINTSVGTG